jgi:AmiR/NasT family two-component response regulator
MPAPGELQHHRHVYRDVIGQAKGILMERYKLSSDKSFRVLVRYSQERT